MRKILILQRLFFAFATIFFCLALLFVPKVAAQKAKRNGLPRVGLIKNVQEAVWNYGEGCGNHQLSLPRKNPLLYKIIFLSEANGADGLMNFDGRNVKLKLVRSTLWYKDEEPIFVRHEYRAGNLKIAVSFENRLGYVRDYPARIVITKGRVSRTIKLVGLGQCDDD